MTRITPDELIYLLENQDPRATYMFVEGDRDLNLWALAVPIQSRVNATIAPIRIIECAAAEDGERGRAIWLARVLESTSVRDRVKFFIDADNDAVLPHTVPNNVIFTDFRDLECYAANDNCVQNLLYAHGRNPDDFELLRDDVFDVGRTLGAARVLNHDGRSGLSFNDAFLKRPGRVLTLRGGRLQLDKAALFERLFSSTAWTFGQRAEFQRVASELECALTDVDPRMVLCGKDFAAILATYFNVEQGDIYRSVHLALAAELNNFRALPQFAAAETFARA